jgi:hypothetical protein
VGYLTNGVGISNEAFLERKKRKREKKKKRKNNLKNTPKNLYIELHYSHLENPIEPPSISLPFLPFLLPVIICIDRTREEPA